MGGFGWGPISANAAHKALTHGETEAADAAGLSEERAELDAAELRELEQGELRPTTTPPTPNPPPKRFWRRLLHR
jgi:hypothetical protein